METLKKLVKQEAEDNLYKRILKMETECGLNKFLQYEGKTYKGNAKAKLIKYLTANKDKQIKEKFDLIDSVANAPDFSEPYIITLEWKKSRLCGSNPKAYTNTGYTSKSIGGFGDDKQSTAVAYALNDNKSILKLLYAKKDREIINWKLNNLTLNIGIGYNRNVLGYGSGYSILPKFEGGVGVSSHIHILEIVGLKMEHTVSTNWTDVFIITNM